MKLKGLHIAQAIMFDEHAFPAKSSEIDLVMKFIYNYFKMFDQHTTYVRLYLSSLSSYFGAAFKRELILASRSLRLNKLE